MFKDLTAFQKKAAASYVKRSSSGISNIFMWPLINVVDDDGDDDDDFSSVRINFIVLNNKLN